MKSIFTKTKLLFSILLVFSIVSIPFLLIYNKYKKYKLQRQVNESVVVCDCCGKWNSESSTVKYIFQDEKYIVCPTGQATDTKELEFALSKNKHIKYLLPF